ncbi:CO dehydrogenase/acetyl-CoA synthase complex subunit epsilon [Archaeoglobus sp.]
MSLLADVQASRSAKVLSGEGVVRVVKMSKYPVLITGGKLLENEKLVDFAVNLNQTGIDIIACSASSKPLIERGVKPKFTTFSLHYITQFLLDPDFRVDGKIVDCALYVGFMPYYLSRALSSMKHFSKIVTVALEPYYQPHATFSLPKLNEDEYYSTLEKIVEGLK